MNRKKQSYKPAMNFLKGSITSISPIDMIQGGAGTTTNMNANEVICNRALQIMGHQPGEFKYLTPNDHVNGSQSTNDAYPTAIHLGLYASHLKLRPHLLDLIDSLKRKADSFAHVLENGTHTAPRCRTYDLRSDFLGIRFDTRA